MSYFKRSAAGAAMVLGTLMVSVPAVGAETGEPWSGQQQVHAEASQQPEQQQALATVAAGEVDVAAHHFEVGDEELAEQLGGRTWFGTLTPNHYRVGAWGIVGYLGGRTVEELVPFLQVADDDLPWHLKVIDIAVCEGVPIVLGGLAAGQQVVAGKADNRELDYLDGLAGLGVGLSLSIFNYGCKYATYELGKNLAAENHDRRRHLLTTHQMPAELAYKLREYNSWAKWATDQAMIAGNEAAKARDSMEEATEILGRWSCFVRECREYWRFRLTLAKMALEKHKQRFAAMSLSAGRAATEYMHRLNTGADERSSLASHARYNFTSSRKVKFQIANDN